MKESMRYNYKIFDFSFSLVSDSSQAVRLFDLVYRNFRQKSSQPSSFSFEVNTNHGRRKVPHLKAAENIYPFHSFGVIESQCFKLVTDEIYRKINSHFWMHGGGVAFRNKGVMVCGDSGAGKTSLILKLLSNGFKFLSDEVIPLDKKTGMMVPFPRSVGLRPEARFLLEKEFSFFKELEFVNLAGHKYFGNPILLKSKRTDKPAFPEYFIYLTKPDSGPHGEIKIDIIIEIGGADFLFSLEKVKGVKILKSIRRDDYIYVTARIKKNASVIKRYLEECKKFKKYIVHTEKKIERGLRFNQKPQIRPLSFHDIGLFLLKQSKDNLMEYNFDQEKFESVGAYWLDLLKKLSLQKMKGFELQVGRMGEMVELLKNFVR